MLLHLKYCSGELPSRAGFVHATLMRQVCVYLVHMSPVFNESSLLQHFKCDNTIKLCNRIMFNVYPGLPHEELECLWYTFCIHYHLCPSECPSLPLGDILPELCSNNRWFPSRLLQYLRCLKCDHVYLWAHAQETLVCVGTCARETIEG